jgi:peptidoglycan/xylan/chitin deacetylase (PgdA/CDA1 family)
MRRATKRFLSVVGIFVAAAALALALFSHSIYRLPILMYHSIDYSNEASNRLIVPPEAFERQMRFLHEKGYRMISLEEAVSLIAQSKRPPPKTVALTIDDGYENMYTNAYPVLKRYRIPVTIFVVVNFVGREGSLTWPEIKEMSNSGIVDVGSHAMSHLWLTGLDDKALKSELEGSREAIESALGKRVSILCYPMGGYDERVKRAAQAAGYRAACATKFKGGSRDRDLYEIKRIRISPTANNLFVFAIKVSGYYQFFRVLQDDYREMTDLVWQKRSS